MKKFLVAIAAAAVISTVGITGSFINTPPAGEVFSATNISSFYETPDVLGIFERASFDKGVITASVLNIRSGASTSFPVVGRVHRNEVVDIIGKVNDWYVIKLENDLVGCVSAGFVTQQSGQNSVQTQPTPQPAPAPQPAPTTQPAPTPQPAPQPTPTVQPNQEALRPEEKQMLDLVNSERTKHGLKPLIIDMEITKVARIKSRDMIDNNYFSHTSPTYGSPFDMMKRFGISYRTAGENLAGNSSVTGAHTALMNSEGHRKNILNPNFTHIGIGIEKGSRYGMMFTQMFVGR